MVIVNCEFVAVSSYYIQITCVDCSFGYTNMFIGMADETLVGNYKVLN